MQRVYADRLGDVLELRRAEIANLKIEPRPDLPVSVLRQTDRARLGDSLQPSRDIYAVAHEVAVGFLDDVADMDSDPELDLPVLGDSRIALNEAALNFEGAAHRIDRAAELDNAPVAGPFDHAAPVCGDGRVEQLSLSQ